MAAASPAPLSTLLSQTLGAMADDFEAGGVGTPLPQWANVLQHVGPQGVERGEMPRVARLSRRLVYQGMQRLEKQGLVTVDTPEPRKKIVRLTAIGSEVAAAGRKRAAAIEKDWTKRYDRECVASLRQSLERVVGQFAHERSHFPAQYGPADPRVTGGGGQDWKDVPRAAGDTVSKLPLSALLSQALVEFTIEYESTYGPLPWGVVTSAVANGVTPLDELPHAVAVYGGGMKRYGALAIKADPKDKRRELVSLTTMGQRIVQAYRAGVVDVERRWTKVYGADDVGTVRLSLESIVDRLEVDYPAHPDPGLMMLWERYQRENAKTSR